MSREVTTQNEVDIQNRVDSLQGFYLSYFSLSHNYFLEFFMKEIGIKHLFFSGNKTWTFLFEKRQIKIPWRAIYVYKKLVTRYHKNM